MIIFLPPSPADAFIIANLIMAMVALPAYLTAHPMPMLALWRVVNTAIGVAVEAAVAATVFPVTARCEAGDDALRLHHWMITGRKGAG